MLDAETKARIDSARDILVGKVPDPKSQVEQITIALIYKFMDDMDRQSEELGGVATFFSGEFKKYTWSRLLDMSLGGHERLTLYADGISVMDRNPNIPQLFRDIFKGAFLPYRDPETLNLFLKEINSFTYEHSERLGDAFEYLLSVLGSQGEAGQFRTPRHIIDFIVRIVDPQKHETILDPACGTAGFLISAYKHILASNSDERPGDKLSGDERARLMDNFCGYDISPDMVRLSRANLYLHGFANPRIHEYDTLTSEDRWDERYDVIMANPPFMSPKGGIRPHNRFSIKARRSEVLFVDYIAEHLHVNGRAGVIVPEGIIFQSQNAYRALRKMLVEGYLWCVVSLPGGVFNPYSGVKTSILLLDKGLAKRTDDILFVKVEADGFDLGAQRRPGERDDLPEAERAIEAWKAGSRLAVGSIAHAVSRQRILESADVNLSGDRYKDNGLSAKMKWPMVKIEDIVEDLQAGFAFGDAGVSVEGIPHLRPMNISSSGDLVWEGTKFIPQSEIADKQAYLLRKGDVLFNNTNSKELVGKTCYIGENVEAVFSNHMTRVR
ncbi:MAG: N-6 DNA methylase, partial [Anaerolineae bacterium]